MADSRIELLGLGISTIDDLLLLSHHPLRNEKQEVLSRTRQCGGLTGTALVAASRLGVSCGHVVSIGEGELSVFLRQAMEREGVRLVENRSNPDAEVYLSIILTERDTGERTILWDGSNAGAPVIGDAEMDLIRAASCVFVDHIYAELLVEPVAEARRCGVDVVGDFERTTPGSLELMDLTNHLIVPLAYAQELLGEGISASEASSRLAARPGRSLACVTDGGNGCWYALGDAPDLVVHQPIFPMAQVVDTTGCGDVFHGVYAAGVVRGLTPRERVLEASAAAALKTQRAGAQAGAPNLRELRDFLRERCS